MGGNGALVHTPRSICRACDLVSSILHLPSWSEVPCHLNPSKGSDCWLAGPGGRVLWPVLHLVTTRIQGGATYASFTPYCVSGWTSALRGPFCVLAVTSYAVLVVGDAGDAPNSGIDRSECIMWVCLSGRKIKRTFFHCAYIATSWASKYYYVFMSRVVF